MHLMLALLLLLAACSVPPPLVAPKRVLSCPAPAEAPSHLPRLVTPEVLRLLYYAERAARLEDEAALATCDARRMELLKLVDRSGM